ncbi:MAG: GNAT family N-acetyltransferase [Anaerolineales bacterium]
MSEIQVLPVLNHRDRETFLTFPWKIYANDPLWVPPLLPDLRKRTDPKRGVFFKRGTARYFVAWHNHEPVGTICVAEDRKSNEETGRREAIFGFFNFVEDYTVMEALLERAIHWASARGLTSLVGPFNLDYEDGYGILVEGRDRPPALMCGHTPPYYLEFVERYGFIPARGDNLAFALDITKDKPVFQELAQMAEHVRQRRKDILIRPADLSHWKDELERVYILLNRSLAHLPDHRPWQREVVFENLAPFRKIADPELVLFAEIDGKTVGWFPGLPNLNEIFIHVNGLRKPCDYLKLWQHQRQPIHCLTIKSILILPEYWGSGVVILLFDEMLRRARERNYKWLDFSLTSADNPRTPVLAKRFGATLYKRYRVYRLEI